MTSLPAMLTSPKVSCGDIAACLDAMESSSRLQVCCALKPRELALLYERAGDAMPDGKGLTFADMLPSGIDGACVRHQGVNSLPVFRRFAKVFFRDPAIQKTAAQKPATQKNGDAPGSDPIWGYNDTTGVVRWFAGPGYFVLREGPKPGELLVDYGTVPGEVPAALPKPAPNTRGTARWVFGGMTDVLRRVSDEVCIGRGQRNGKAMDAWFVLCRGAARPV